MISRLQHAITFGKYNTNTGTISQIRSFKNFGHKRQPEAIVTVIWQGFLTLSFISTGINWNKLKTLVFGDAEPQIELKENYTITKKTSQS